MAKRMQAHPLDFSVNIRNSMEGRPLGGYRTFGARRPEDLPDEIEIFYTQRTGKGEVFVRTGMKDEWTVIYQCTSDPTYQLLVLNDN